MGILNVVRVCLQAFAAICLLTGIAVTFAGMFTTRWQVADFGPKNVHEHGLWKDCQNSASQTVKTVDGNWLCFLKFDKATAEEHKMKEWHLQVLCLLGAANALALIAAICAMVACCCAKYCTIPWTVISFCATVVSAAGLFLFYRWAHESENRIDYDGQIRVEQHYGESFGLAIAGSVIYLFVTFIGVLCSVLICVDGRRGKTSTHKTYPKINHSHNTVV